MDCTRRHLMLAGVAIAAISARPAAATNPMAVAVAKAPGCECCEAWAAHLRENGFAVTVTELVELNAFKTRLRIPADLRSCHTAQIGNYVLEGHVPALAVQRLLREKPLNTTGLAVPGMPAGSPGMDQAGTAFDIYSVILFGPDGRRDWARFRGASPI